MNDSKQPQPDHRKLIPIWIEEEKILRAEEEKPAALAVDAETQSKIEALLDKDLQRNKDGIRRKPSEQAIDTSEQLFVEAMKKMDSQRTKLKLPTQYEREQTIMKMRAKLAPNQVIISPSALEKREDIFEPRVRGKAKVKFDLYNQEGNPDVNRVENWCISGYVWGLNGGDACAYEYYWRYRIWVPNFDTSVQPDRRLEVTPMAVLSGALSLYSFYTGVLFADQSNASVKVYFSTGTWHWHYTTSGYEPEWSGWRRSRPVVSRGINIGNITQGIAVPYPGTQVETPTFWPQPGVSISPNPINNYGTVGPLDVVDFYVRPVICAETIYPFSFARLDFSMIDVPFVRAAFETGYYL